MKLPTLFKRQTSLARAGKTPHHWDLSASLLELSPYDTWTIGHSVEGLLSLGRSGGGKTSGSGVAAANAMLLAGYGGLVLVAKGDEIRHWDALCRATGRSEDLIVVHPGGPWTFNPVDHELRLKGDAASVGRAERVVGMYSAILDLIDRSGSAAGTSGGGRDSEAFWRQATTRMVRIFVELLILAMDQVRITDLYQAVLSAPRSIDEARSEAWKESLCYRLLRQADDKPKSPAQKHDFGLVIDYITREWPMTPEKTRGSILAMFTAMSDCLQRGVLHELFGQGSTFTPEACEEGRIIIVALPAKEFGLLGIVANVLMKFAFQRCIERRTNVGPETRPVFLYADEAQLFVTGTDAMYQATCRSAKAATVYLSQNLSNFYLSMGSGDKGRAEADSLLANLNTRIFHANGCAVTNEWAATQIGRTKQLFMNMGRSTGDQDWFSNVTGMGHQSQNSSGMSEQMDFEVQPSAFTTLRTGGPAHGGLIDAIVYQSGRRFNATGRTWLPVTFRQR